MIKCILLFVPCFIMLSISTITYAKQDPDVEYAWKQDSISSTYNYPNVRNDLIIDSVILKLKQDTMPPVREKKFLRAGSEWFLAQAFPAAFNRFITKDPYSYISFKNFIDHQRISAWDWDDNQFTTNHIDHPFHGQLYFNSFRSNGYNLPQSSIATVVGSYIWETAGETQAPSINDFVNTTFGGILLGEMMHRVSRHVIGKGRNGRNKKRNEITGFLINPVNGLNRWLDGKSGSVDDYYAV